MTCIYFVFNRVAAGKPIIVNPQRAGVYTQVVKPTHIDPTQLVAPMDGPTVDAALAAGGLVQPTPGGMAAPTVPTVEVIMSPSPVVQPAPNVITPGQRTFVAPMEGAVAPTAVVGNIVESPVAVVPPNGDEAIVQAGSYVHASPGGENMVMSQPVHPNQMHPMQQQVPQLVQPTGPPVGGMTPGMMQAGNQAQGMMPPNMAQMQGMMAHYMTPFSATGNAVYTNNHWLFLKCFAAYSCGKLHVYCKYYLVLLVSVIHLFCDIVAKAIILFVEMDAHFGSTSLLKHQLLVLIEKHMFLVINSL